MKKCIICGRTDMKTDSFCTLCSYIIGASHLKYDMKQLMALYSHIVGAKIIQDITNATYSALKNQYEAKKAKNEGRLN